MTLTRQILLGYAAVIAALVVVAAVGVYGHVRTDHETQEVARLEDADDVPRDVRYTVRDIVANVRGLLLYRDSRQDYLAKTTAGLSRIDAALETLQRDDAASVLRDSVAKLAAEEEPWHAALLQIVETVKAGDYDKGFSLLEAQTQRERGLVSSVTKLIDVQQEQLATQQDALDAQANDTLTIMLVVGALGIGGAIAAAVLVTRSVRRALQRAVHDIGTSSAEMLAVAAQVASGAAESSASISEASATASEVRQTAELATERAVELGKGAEETSLTADEGAAAVDETAAGIVNIAEQMDVISASVVRLSERTDSVNDVIGSVADLADQSNLLSVNAAIEAAKAGEHGRGFAVVAQEIKNLADQSKRSVEQVRGTLVDIQKATAEAVMATELGGKAIATGTERSKVAREAIDALANRVSETVLAFRQLVASAEQQYAGMDQIASAMATIEEASAQNVAGSRQVEAEVQHLRDLARSLERLIDRRAVESASRA